jgi:hypothetical protein
MLKVWEERGQKPPLSFEQELEGEGSADQPELSWLEQQYLLVFNMASTCRPVAFSGCLPLPYLTMRGILDREGWSGSEAESAMYVVRKMDEEIMRIWDSESNKDSGARKRA